MAIAKGLLDLTKAGIDLGADAYRNLLRLIEAGYPDTTAMKIVTGELPMDNASRMARATEQGKTDLAYHVSNDAMNEGPNGMEFTDKGILSFMVSSHTCLKATPQVVTFLHQPHILS